MTGARSYFSSHTSKVKSFFNVQGYQRYPIWNPNNLEMFLDSKLDFKGHTQNLFNKVSKTIWLLRKLSIILPRHPLKTIYKSVVRSHLGYGDIIYDSVYNFSFHQRLESIQNNAAPVITGAIRGTYREKLYHELGFEYLEGRR